MTRRGVTILLIVVLLAAGAIFASIRLLATERVVYLAADATSSDPFTPPAVFTADSPAPPQPIDPTVAITTPTAPTDLGGNPGPVGGSVKKGDCDPELLIQFLNANSDRLAAWLSTAGVQEGDFEDHVRGSTPAVLSRDTRVTNTGFREGSVVEIQSILAVGTAVLVDESGNIAVRCMSGSPLKAPEQISNYRCDGCPSDLGATPPCNQTCYDAQGAGGLPTTTTTGATSTTGATTTTRAAAASTTRRATSNTARRATTRRPATTAPGTQPPVTASFFSTSPPTPTTTRTFPPAATAPPSTQPPTTQGTAPTIPPSSFPPAATTTQPPATTTTSSTDDVCLPLIGCV